MHHLLFLLVAYLAQSRLAIFNWSDSEDWNTRTELSVELSSIENFHQFNSEDWNTRTGKKRTNPWALWWSKLLTRFDRQLIKLKNIGFPLYLVTFARQYNEWLQWKDIEMPSFTSLSHCQNWRNGIWVLFISGQIMSGRSLLLS